MAMPEVEEDPGAGQPGWSVRGKGFVAHRGPRRDAVDPGTGERYQDVVLFWVPDLSAKDALVGDPTTPFFTTAHFDGYRAVLLRTSLIAEVSRDELTEVVVEAWLARAPRRLASAWLAERG